MFEAIQEFASQAEPKARLLRTYWYDGIRAYSGPSAEQLALGKRHFVKLRLGMLNSQGQQKGVDSLIVTDLIDLARNRAITDAVILAGDEDLRVGVQVAQSYGVRVHLIGVAPTRGNVSRHLIQEVDSTFELDRDRVEQFLSCSAQDAPDPTTKLPVDGPKPELETDEDRLKGVVESVLNRFDKAQLEGFTKYLSQTESLPREVDAPILAQGRHEFKRDLTVEEKRLARSLAKGSLRQ